MAPTLQPVYDGYLADPFVLRHRHEYFAVGTGPIAGLPESTTAMKASNGPHSYAFPIVRSTDLKHWESLGGALQVPEWAKKGDFWAPEIAHSNGLFYLYYSVAIEGLKHILRVAVSTSPGGPYIDHGPLMPPGTDCPFAIDPHPFQDVDGRWYLFYAKDFLDCDGNTRPGTALVVDELVQMVALAGKEQTVLRAQCEWQRFQKDRMMYGQILDWHTLEGPAVRRRNGQYYCLYSGGCF